MVDFHLNYTLVSSLPESKRNEVEIALLAAAMPNCEMIGFAENPCFPPYRLVIPVLKHHLYVKHRLLFGPTA